MTRPVRPPPLRPDVYCSGCGMYLGKTDAVRPHRCSFNAALICLALSFPLLFLIYAVSSPMGQQIRNLLSK